MTTLRQLLALVLVVSHVLLGGGLFVSCIEQDGARATELALAGCCDRLGGDAPRAPAPAATLRAPAGDCDDCGACVDERLGAPAERPHRSTASLLPAPAALPVAFVALDVAPREVAVEPAARRADAPPRRLRPAVIRP